MSTFQLLTVTSRAKILDQECDFLLIRTTEGDMGILPNHAPLVAEVSAGEMRVRKDNETKVFWVIGGFIEISDNKVTVLADEAVHPDEIDVMEERKKIERMQAELAASKEDKEVMLIEKNLKETLMKISVGEKRY